MTPGVGKIMIRRLRGQLEKTIPYAPDKSLIESIKRAKRFQRFAILIAFLGFLGFSIGIITGLGKVYPGPMLLAIAIFLTSGNIAIAASFTQDILRDEARKRGLEVRLS